MQWVTGLFPGGKVWLGRGLDHQPHIELRLKKEYSYNSTPPLGLRGLFQGEIYPYNYCINTNCFLISYFLVLVLVGFLNKRICIYLYLFVLLGVCILIVRLP